MVVVAVRHGLTGRVSRREVGAACDAQTIGTSRSRKKYETWCRSLARKCSVERLAVTRREGWEKLLKSWFFALFGGEFCGSDIGHKGPK